MLLFKVDCGEVWTVAANNKDEALVLWFTDILDCEGDWPEERPDVRVLDPAKPYTLTLDGGKKVELIGHEWLEILQHPQVLGCSLI